MKFLSPLFKKKNANADHQSIIDSIDNQLNQIDKDTDLIKPMMKLSEAEGIWLDEWGSWFGAIRNPGELDDDYRLRIKQVLTDEKVTIPALIKMTRRVLGEDTVVTVYETYNDIRLFNVSTFSGKGRYEDSDYYQVGVVDIKVNKPVTEELVEILNLTRGSTIKIKFTYTPAEIVSLEENENPLSFYSVYSGEVVEDNSNEDTFSGSNPIRFSGSYGIWTK